VVVEEESAIARLAGESPGLFRIADGTLVSKCLIQLPSFAPKAVCILPKLYRRPFYAWFLVDLIPMPWIMNGGVNGT
jgi:hypothetical protein